MAVLIVEHEISVVISDDEEPDEIIIDFTLVSHLKTKDTFGSQSRPVGSISPVCCFSSDDEIGCLDVEDIS